MGNALQWQVFCPTAYTFAQRLHTCEFKDAILEGDPAGNALTVAAWGFVTSATTAEAALDGSAIGLQAIQKVLLDKHKLSSTTPVLNKHTTALQSEKSIGYMKQSALNARSAQYGGEPEPAKPAAAPTDSFEDPQHFAAARTTSEGSMTTTPMTAPGTPLPLVFCQDNQYQTPDASRLGGGTPFAGGLLIPLPGCVTEKPPAGGSSRVQLPRISLPGNLVLPLSQESNCTVEDEDVCLNVSNTSFQFTSEEPETPGVDALTPTHVHPVMAARKPVQLVVAVPPARESFSWANAAPGQQKAARATTLKLNLSKRAPSAPSHPLALLQREPTVLDRIAAQLGFVPVISVGFTACPAEVAV